ncbi:Panacea domain-containing protein [Mycoplasmopsis pullorum]|uniref:Panacea domain-containing protein n=1 Tax=Mycoplasmopsis pullorum TaxID=48003 RepID=UPI00111ADC2D|nr:type II toxin-antitoxin system antitoxin SocA domain-containing protein [Mycoplasmopsis pullorum]TNK83279.1 hypothetical protein C4M93_02655 [Mycoplasmopsis pullorum]TNK88081.1 hypothetical protein C4M89_03720 [Mycoplasmopsis pullorum]TNK91782.1 hypothetical protein C4M96_03440 [Mycoplasmopsis pullorum]
MNNKPIPYYNLSEILNLIIQTYKEKGLDVPLKTKLMKILYYIQAAVLVETNNKYKAFNETFQAWHFGPFIYDLWSKIDYWDFWVTDREKSVQEYQKRLMETIDELSKNNPKNIANRETMDQVEKTQIETEVKNVILATINVSRNELIISTHKDDPWKNIFSSKELKDISLDSIYEFYTKHKERLFR